jgi:hypothetical protein
VALTILKVLAARAAPADERYAKRHQNGTTNSFHSMSQLSVIEAVFEHAHVHLCMKRLLRVTSNLA